MNPPGKFRIDDMRKPAAGIIVHIGEVTRGAPRLDDLAIARVDAQRRHDIMRNHTATHLLHAGFVPSSASMPPGWLSGCSRSLAV